MTRALLVTLAVGGPSTAAEPTDDARAFTGTANLDDYERFLDAIAASFGGTKGDRPEEYRQRSAEALTMPVAFAAGNHDDVVPPESVLRGHARLAGLGRKVLLHRPGRGHDADAADTAAVPDFEHAGR